jgi:hypothetical protein
MQKYRFILNSQYECKFNKNVVSALFPQNLKYDGYQFRTAHLNKVIATIFSLEASFTKQKGGQNGTISILSASRPQA